MQVDNEAASTPVHQRDADLGRRPELLAGAALGFWSRPNVVRDYLGVVAEEPKEVTDESPASRPGSVTFA